MNEFEWIGVDLDGCLSYAEKGKPLNVIGDPIPIMLDRVRVWMQAGHKVKILTAKAVPALMPYIKRWMLKYGLQELEVTDTIDLDMKEYWSAKTITVGKNTGVPANKILKVVE